ncbi:DUF58 domain-containing protein [Pseudoalteromonas mariniglutinosa]|uniref:DUF58 domain-containing protein n=1 Tax=Pseudoalteromonas mariniglutinosa TaxID=206042 RepID=UPI00384FAF43
MLSPPTFMASLKDYLVSKLLKDKHKKNSITLSHSTIYVLPSKLGWQFLAVALLNFIMGINYQNNLILAMAYLMVVIIVFTFLKGYKNLLGLTVEFKCCQGSFAPNKPSLVFNLISQMSCQSVQFIDHYGAQSSVTSVTGLQPVTLTLSQNQRGIYEVKRIKVISHFPFGLVSVWSYIEPNTKAVIYPQAKADNLSDSITATDEIVDDTGLVTTGSDEFHQLIDHQESMGINRISWKHYAKTQQLLIKEFSSYSRAGIELNFNMLSGNAEQRLSQLCFLICKLNDANTPFSLSLPTIVLPESCGEAHKNACLYALAAF